MVFQQQSGMKHRFGIIQVQFAGTSLVEILVAITILSFALAPIFALFTFASRGTATSVPRVQAHFLAHAVIEALQAQALRDPLSVRDFPYIFEASPVRRESYKFGERYHIELFRNTYGYNLPITPDSPLYKEFEPFRIIVNFSRGRKPGMFDVWVTVSWNFEGKTQKVDLKSNLDITPCRFVK